MSRKDKLIKRLKSKPKDFSLEELETLLEYLGYTKSNKGKTSGSRLKYTKDSGTDILLHRPHPTNILPKYLIDQLVDILSKEGLI